MEWAIAELVNNPNIQHKIHDEISTVLQGKPNLHELPYLLATVNETLSKARRAYNSKESKAVLNSWWQANNPAWWKDLEEVRPERFLEVEHGTEAVAGGKVDLRYLPFGMGRIILCLAHPGSSNRKIGVQV
ncbi:LOW QUALITY PROTEIN: Cytochrome P450 [Dillenia turbinata]|uniref:Cytochrome P450 n=1 Tax=Dillenia turbinata TaxID=194707 RepID=A0AAN8WAE5_9MAGN